MKIVIKKNLSVLDADENFTYVIEATHHDRIVNQSIVKVPSNEYNQPCEEKCGSLTRASIDGILDPEKLISATKIPRTVISLINQL